MKTKDLEKRKMFQKEYYQRNKESIREKKAIRKKAWYAANREIALKKSREYYLQNKVKVKEKARLWSKNNKQKTRDYTRKSKTRQRKLAYDFVNFVKTYLGCYDCKINNHHVLHFHHLDSLTKKMNLAKMTGSGYSIKTIKQEIKKGIFLCANCHIIRHATEKTGNYTKNG